MGVLPYRSYFPPIHLNMEKMDAWANGEMHEKKGEKKNPSFSRSRTGKEGNTDIDFKTPEITMGTQREKSLVRTAPKR